MTAPSVEAHEVVRDAITELNTQRPPDEQIDARLDTPLFGREGVLDSLALVTLLLEVEDRVRHRFDVSVTIMDQRAMSEERSPFGSVAALAHYVDKRVAEARAR